MPIDRARLLAQPFALPPRRTWAWALPLLVAFGLVALVAAWLQITDVREIEDRRHTLISDTLSLEQQLRTRFEFEQRRANAIAQAVADGTITPSNFAQAPLVVAALRDPSASIAWLDDADRVVARTLESAAPHTLATDTPESNSGAASTRFEARVPANAARWSGRIVMPYSLSGMLAEHTPWWLARSYLVRMVDGFGEVLATTAQPGERADGDTHRISFDPPLRGTYVELQQRDLVQPWYRTQVLLPFGLVLAVLAWSTWLLRRQVRSVERAEAAWRGEAAWRAAMEDSLTVGLRARDLDGRLIYAHPSFHDMLGFEAHELLGRAPPLPYWPPDAIEETFIRFRRNLEGGAPREGYEALWRHKDGRELVVMVFEAPLVDAQGRQVGWMGSTIDVTEHRRQQELERQRAEHTAHQARLMTMGEIASSLAHELNQPLTAITSYNAGLRNALQALPNVDARILAALEKQGEQAAHAGRIVQRIREFLARRAPRQERCDLRDSTQRALELLDGELRRLRVDVRLDTAPQPVAIEADPVLIEQVIVNLVRNACDLAKRVRIRVYRHDDHACFEIVDDGPGLQGRSIDDLAAPFYSTKAEGMGLGLAICRSIVEAHLGRLTANDVERGSGACFAFELPLMERTHA